jgi:putative tricarboxylic transport membrane protein
MAESSFRQAMLLSQGSLTIFWANGLVGSIVTLALVMLFWPMLSTVVGKLAPRRALPAQ